MPDSSFPSSRPDQPWQAASEPRMSRGGRMFRRWATTSIAICLIALYVYLIIPPQIPRTQIVAVTNRLYELGSVPPIPYSLEDVAAIEEIVKLRDRKDLVLTTLTNPLPEGLLQEATPAASHRFRGRLRKRFRTDDALLLYISAHGVTENGIPYLLCSGDFQLLNSAAASGRLDVTELLGQLEQGDRKPKLLVLDTGWIASDPRLGMVFNEFPHLVERQIKEIDDPNLWVLLASSMFETCAVVNSQHRSVFGLSFTEAFQGKRGADKDGDGLLSLAELYTYVYSCCDDTQTPLLMQGGKGLIDPVDIAQIDEFVVPVTPPNPPENGAEPEDEAPNGGPDGGQRRTDASGATASFAVGRRVSLASASFSLAMLQTTGRAGQPELQPNDARTEPQAGVAHGSKQDRGDPVDSPAAGRPAESTEGGNSGSKTEGRAATDENRRTPSPTTPHQQPPASGAMATDHGEQADKQAINETTDLHVMLYQAWKYRDRLAGLPLNDLQGTRLPPEKREQGQWSPVDYAPNLWRKLNGLLLDHERLYRSNAAETIDLTGTRYLQEIVAELKEALDAPVSSPGAAPTQGKGAVFWIREAQQRFLQRSPAARSANGQRPNRLVQTVRFYNDMVFLAPYYVRWHAQAILTCAEPTDPQADRIEKFLECLTQMRDQLAAATASKPGELDERPLFKAREDLLSSWRTLEMDLRDARENALNAAESPASGRLLEDQLNMLYLPAEDRKEIVDAVRDGGKNMRAAERGRSPVDFHPDAISLHASEWPKWRWRQLRKQADFEYQLVCLAHGKESPEASNLKEQLEQLDDNELEPANALDCYRQIGDLLKGDYVAIAGKVAGLMNDEKSFEQELHVWHLMCMEDPRDVRPVVYSSSADQVDVFSWTDAHAKPRIELTVVPKGQLVLDTKSPKRLTVSVKTSYPAASKPGAPSINFRFGPNLEVHRFDGTQRVKIVSGDPVCLPPGVPDAKLEFDVRCLEPRAPLTPLGNLDIMARGPRECTDKESIPCTRNAVDLVVTRIDFPNRPFEQQRPRPNAVALRPFPNRLTEFQFELVNLSGEKKEEVEVQLYAVRRPAGATWPPGLILQPSQSPERRLPETLPGIEGLLFKENGAIKSDVQLVASTAKDASLVLPVATKPKPVQLVPAKAGKLTTNGATAAGGKGDAGPEITNGLVCIIHDKATQTRWIKWLEIVPLRPEDYLEASFSGQHQNRISIEVTPRKDLGSSTLPSNWKDPPLEFRCHLDRQSGERLQGGSTTVSMDASTERATIDLVKPNRLPATIFIDVDDYPRAFAYTIPEHAAPPTKATERRAELVQLEMGKTIWPFRLDQPDQRASFPRTTDPFVVVFEVDAHKNDFSWHNGQEPNVIELAYKAINPTGNPTEKKTAGRFYADRRVTTRLAKAGTDGRLGILAKVTDYRFEIDPEKLPKGPFRIWPTLKVGGHSDSRRPMENGMEAVLDDEKPRMTIHSARPHRRAASASVASRTIRVELQVNDWSDIEKIDFEILRDWNTSGQEPGKFPIPRNRFTRSNTGEIRVDLHLDAKKFPPGRYRLIGSATDRAGNTGSSEPYKLTIPKPSAPATAAGPKKYGIICGRVKIGTYFPNPPDRFTVTLADSGLAETETREMGRFLFTRVPLGKQYTVTARGNYQNHVKAGRAEDIEPAPKDQPEKADYGRLTLTLE